MKGRIAVGVMGLCTALMQGALASNRETVLSWTLRAPRADKIRARAELTGSAGGGGAALEFELRRRGQFVGIVARRVVPPCAAHATLGCDLGLVRLAASQVDVFYASPARRRGIRLRFDRQANTSGVTLTARVAGLRDAPKLSATSDARRFRVAGETGGKRYLREGVVRGPEGAPALGADQLAMLALIDVLGQILDESPASSHADATPRSFTETTTEEVPGMGDGDFDCLAQPDAPGCPESGSHGGSGCWMCDFCEDLPGGQTLGGCLGQLPGWGGGDGGGGLGGPPDPIPTPHPTPHPTPTPVPTPVPTPTPLPDLVIRTVTRGVAPPHAGEIPEVTIGSRLVVGVRVANDGPGDSGPYDVDFFLSPLNKKTGKPTGAVVALDDPRLAVTTGLAASRSSATLTHSTFVKTGTHPGIYFICAKVDPDNKIAENGKGEDNNTYCGQKINAVAAP